MIKPVQWLYPLKVEYDRKKSANATLARLSLMPKTSWYIAPRAGRLLTRSRPLWTWRKTQSVSRTV